MKRVWRVISHHREPLYVATFKRRPHPQHHLLHCPYGTYVLCWRIMLLRTCTSAFLGFSHKLRRTTIRYVQVALLRYYRTVPVHTSSRGAGRHLHLLYIRAPAHLSCTKHHKYEVTKHTINNTQPLSPGKETSRHVDNEISGTLATIVVVTTTS